MIITSLMQYETCYILSDVMRQNHSKYMGKRNYSSNQSLMSNEVSRDEIHLNRQNQ